MKFSTDNKDIKKLIETMKRFPEQVKPAIAKTLNKQAAAMKFQHMPKALDKDLVIRDPKFMNRQLRFNQAKPRQSVKRMHSEAGSVGIEGGSKGAFTGWEEQQTGQPAEKNRVSTTASRVGNKFSGKMKPGRRMKTKNKFLKPTDFMNSKRVHSKNQAMFFMMREARKSRRPFIISRGFRRTGATRRMKAGLYGLVGKRLMRLQTFDKKYNPKRTDWMGDSIKLLVKKRGGFDKVFSKELERIVNQFNRMR